MEEHGDGSTPDGEAIPVEESLWRMGASSSLVGCARWGGLALGGLVVLGLLALSVAFFENAGGSWDDQIAGAQLWLMAGIAGACFGLIGRNWLRERGSWWGPAVQRLVDRLPSGSGRLRARLPLVPGVRLRCRVPFLLVFAPVRCLLVMRGRSGGVMAAALTLGLVPLFISVWASGGWPPPGSALALLGTGMAGMIPFGAVLAERVVVHEIPYDRLFSVASSDDGRTVRVSLRQPGLPEELAFEPFPDDAAVLRRELVAARPELGGGESEETGEPAGRDGGVSAARASVRHVSPLVHRLLFVFWNVVFLIGIAGVLLSLVDADLPVEAHVVVVALVPLAGVAWVALRAHAREARAGPGGQWGDALAEAEGAPGAFVGKAWVRSAGHLPVDRVGPVLLRFDDEGVSGFLRARRVEDVGPALGWLGVLVMTDAYTAAFGEARSLAMPVLFASGVVSVLVLLAVGRTALPLHLPYDRLLGASVGWRGLDLLVAPSLGVRRISLDFPPERRKRFVARLREVDPRLVPPEVQAWADGVDAPESSEAPSDASVATLADVQQRYQEIDP